MTESAFVCARCGLGIHRWGSTQGWKHAAGGPVRSCGKPPAPIERNKYDLEIEDEIDQLWRNGWGIDEAREEVLRARLEDEES